ASNKHVANHACVACAPGTTRAAGDDASAADTTCNATTCGANQYVASHACVACPTGTTHAAGDDASGSDTSCTNVPSEDAGWHAVVEPAMTGPTETLSASGGCSCSTVPQSTPTGTVAAWASFGVLGLAFRRRQRR